MVYRKIEHHRSVEPPIGGFFIDMNIYVYSDESGVFDEKHQDYFVFGAILFLDEHTKNECSRRFKAIEKSIANTKAINGEIKSSRISKNDKRRLFKVLKPYKKFIVAINIKRIFPQIMSNKKTKQRYLDFAYKLGLKFTLRNLISESVISEKTINNIYVYCDEHTTATDGIYELEESIEQDLKIGTFSSDYKSFHPPLFSNMQSVQVKYLDSKYNTLIRCADIIANYGLNCVRKKNLKSESNLNVIFLP